jgi:NAD(P)-dependent dehydrogenase (short-subunit alcohol dehydrogenase family)
MRELANKVPLVTGANRGIGRVIAEALAGDGAMVVVHYGQNFEAANETVTLIASRRGRHFRFWLTWRLPKRSSASSWRWTSSSLRVREAVNSTFRSGLASPASYRGMSAAQFDHLFAVNVRRAFLMTQAAIPRNASWRKDH